MRLPLQTAVSCRVGGKHFQAGCINISETGMLLENSGGLVVGDELSLEFSLPGAHELVTLRAKIVRKDPEDHIGVQFTVLTPDHLQAIQDYVTGKVAL
jgi:hypothetical protein